MEGLQRCFVLHSRPYSETSLILDVFSENHGRVSLMAKGARGKRSPLKGALQPFTPLLMKWSGRGEMHTMRHAEAMGLAIPLSGNALFSGFYLNEILSRVVEPETAYHQLFFDYVSALTELAQFENPEPALRRFELALLESLGYGVDFLHCAGSGEPVGEGMTYIFREQMGFVASLMKSHNLAFQGSDLIALSSRQFSTTEQLKAAKRFTRLALKPYLGSKPLKSRELFLLRTRKSTQ
ncbi:DNA repair protein RecO [Enterovibrio norvegicus]|uniref:DNA repair protein RecO n=2 Tax=Enterovibrio norvegicus TaxID=188144 RepID=A0A1I5UXK9_9GAMM|nr:DNA repair protein RecO [Enterovibrio norvegicus]MCC4800734.1 DNA repair protein RecO [Enterovibrio norvegicus]OEE46254.1 DNA repair protein RecO [Enterovibrio norvegicus]OEF51192.1 DNA repair protein RecO [Enterovibrio norvegicus]OEF57266.1 DNA repair protein RecO [Enterovibrio norvegicus]PMH66571.1 DNA repair protein RecO [Enterovibrio norvegicus]